MDYQQVKEIVEATVEELMARKLITEEQYGRVPTLEIVDAVMEEEE